MYVLIKLILTSEMYYISIFIKAPGTQLSFRIWGSELKLIIAC